MVKKVLAFFITFLFVGTNIVSGVSTQSKLNIQNTLYAGGSGPGNYSKIQDAVNDATNGTTVFVYSGIYYEQVVIEGKSINLIGENRDTTIVDGSQTARNPVVNIFQTHFVNISGFTIQNGQEYGGGIWVTGGGYNKVTGNKCIYNNGEGGISIKSSNYNVISDNICNSNSNCGIFMMCTDPDEGAHDNAIVNNTCNYNKWDGIYLCYFDYNNISNNICNDNGEVGYDELTGIALLYSDYNHICNNTCNSKSHFGILLDHCDNGFVKNNTCMSCAIHLLKSTNHTLIDNKVDRGIHFEGDDLSCWDTHTMNNNSAYGKDILYYKNTNGSLITIPDGIAQIILANCTGFNIKNINFSNTIDAIQMGYCKENNIDSNTISSIDIYGISLQYSYDNTITNNTILNTACLGICLSYSQYNSIFENEISAKTYGFYCSCSENNTIYKNNVKNCNEGLVIDYLSTNNVFSFNDIRNNVYGLSLAGSYTNIVKDNNLNRNVFGIFLCGATDNTIYKNNIMNSSYGIYLYKFCDSNVFSWNNISYSTKTGLSIIYHSNTHNIINNNNFRWNQENAHDEDTNKWYNATLKIGNYYDDYLWSDKNNDGIADDPYKIPGGNNKDFYPLTKPWGLDDNNPNKPDKPKGPLSGKIKTEYSYTSNATDPDMDNIYYLFDWGDKTNSGWLGPYKSGENISCTHTWNKRGNYKIRVKAKDVYGVQSQWSDSLTIKMPKNSLSIRMLILQLLDRFPNAFPILRHLMELQK